jgi:uncharacterized protein YndB with AHSA1/START domain
MPVVDVIKNTDQLTLTFIAEFEAGIDRVWQVWEDPRQLERWWGPPSWPATFETHEFAVGGRSAYYMTGPDGTKAHGWWEITAINAPESFEFDDGFSDDNGEPVTPIESSHGVVTLEAIGEKTRMTTVSHFESLDLLERMVEMGMEEGMRLAMGQIDGILAEVSV